MEDITIHAVIHYHDAVLQRLIEQLMARPQRKHSSALRNLVAFFRSGGKRPHPDLIDTGFVGFVSDPASVGREPRKEFIGRCSEEWLRRTRLRTLGIRGVQRQNPNVCTGLGSDVKVSQPASVW